jgi:uncharacterized membrane protein YbhN (UPF0104 family)
VSALSSTRPDRLFGDSAARGEGLGRRLGGRWPRVSRRAATAALLIVFLIVLLASVPGLQGVGRQIGRIGPLWLAGAVALELLSCLSFVVVFRLFFDRLEASDARLMAWTEQASGALLPGGGAGGLAIGAGLMRLTGQPVRWIVRRSAALFFLSAAVSSAGLVAAGLALIAGAARPDDLLLTLLPTALAAGATVIVASLPAVVGARSRAPRWLRALAGGVGEAEHVVFARRPSWRLVGAGGYLVFDIAVLWLVLRAFGHAPSVAIVTLAYSIGYAANSLPVPGGVGVLDAGLTGALVLYGVSPVPAAAAVIIYHAIAFWVPGLGGLLAYTRLRPRLVASHEPSLLASQEVPHEDTGHTSQARRPRLGGDAHRRTGTRPVHWTRRQAPGAALPGQPEPG